MLILALVRCGTSSITQKALSRRLISTGVEDSMGECLRIVASLRLPN